MKQKVKTAINNFIPPHSLLHTVIKSIATQVGLARKRVFSDKDYREWIKENEPSINPSSLIYEDVLVSVVVPCWNTPDKYLIPLIESFSQQTNQTGWEVVLVDVSTNNERSEAIKLFSKDSSFITYVKAENKDISSNTNIGIMHATGSYIAFMDHDDVLAVNALDEVLRSIDAFHPDILYTDEDKITDNGRIRHSPYFKPEWSPDVMLYTNYLNHFTIISKSHIDTVGGLDPVFNGSQDYDLLLNILAKLKNPKVIHIPKILYHWREADGSTALNHSNKTYAFVAGKKTIEKYLVSIGVTAKTVHIKDSPGFYSQSITPKGSPRIVVNINPESGVSVDEIKKRTQSKLNIIYTNNEDTSPDVIIRINDNVLPTQSDWIDRMVGVLSLPDVETVSPRLLSSEGGFIENAGRVHIEANQKFEDYHGLLEDEYTPTGSVRGVRDIEQAIDAVYAFKSQSKVRGRNVMWSHVNFVKNAI